MADTTATHYLDASARPNPEARHSNGRAGSSGEARTPALSCRMHIDLSLLVSKNVFHQRISLIYYMGCRPLNGSPVGGSYGGVVGCLTAERDLYGPDSNINERMRCRHGSIVSTGEQMSIGKGPTRWLIGWDLLEKNSIGELFA